MPELRFALVMGGGVSLGSFSAGALSRLMHLLTYLERGEARVDVVTGASAGSMTLGIVLYHLFRGSTPSEIEAALRSSWVERITFDALAPDFRYHARPSLFSDRIVREIADESLDFGRWDERAPHPYFAEGTLVSFALTNLNGIPVRTEGQMIRQPSLERASSGAESAFADALQTTFHDDVIRFALYRGEVPPEGPGVEARVLRPWTSDERRAEWLAFKAGAVASGAFPGAFPPVRLPRRREEYSIWPDVVDADGFVFDYVDGGALRNEPLREAIHLAAVRDAGSEVERVFVLIDPHVSGTRERLALGHNQRLALKAEHGADGSIVRTALSEPGYLGRLTSVLGRFASVLASQAAFRDWLRAARVNSQVEWRDELTEILEGVSLPDGTEAEGKLDGLLTRIYTEKVLRSVAGDASTVDMERVRARIARDLATRANGRPVGAQTKLLLVVDLIANLREKRKINMVAITPTTTTDGKPLPIAGDFLASFGGFFDESLRRHDYAAGEFAASEVLTATIPGARRLLRAEAPRLDRPDSPAVDPSFRTLPAEARERFEGVLHGHARSAAAMLGVPGPFRGIAAKLVRSRLRNALTADHVRAAASFLVEVAGAEGLVLGGAAGGSDARAQGGEPVRTVVSIFPAAEGAYRLVGPHLQSGEEADARLELWERGWLGRRRWKATVRLVGPPGDWLRAARIRSVAVLRTSVREGAIIDLSPANLADEAVVLR